MSSRKSMLAKALRSCATRAAECADSGCALIFAALPGDDSDEPATRLRAAAGFADPETAKRAAAAALPWVREAAIAATGTERDALAEAGTAGSGGSRVLPLAIDDEVRGVLVVGLPERAPECSDALEEIAALAALRLDHAHLRAQLADEGDDEPAVSEEPDSDELLRLSEALFTQDIELLRSNEKLGKIEKLKNDFIEKMSRELRTPLNSIIEAIIGVLAGEHEQISDHAKVSLRNALDEGTAFQRTLQNILDLWRIKQNELPVELQEVNVGEVVEEAIFSVQDVLGVKPVEIHKEIDPSLPKVRTDLAKVNQLLFLLLDNAVKFTAQGDVHISARLREDRLVCEIADTGIGVCPDDQEYLFDEFFQVDAHSSTSYRGAGLGLSLVRDLVVLLDGEVAYESEAGKGTRIWFEIPVEPV